MEMSIRDYAKSRNVAYESVRRQTQRYKKELKDSIKTVGNKKILSDDAIKFLDAHRMPRNVVVQASDNDAEKELQRLRNENDRLRNELLLRQSEIIALQNNQMQLIEDKTKTAMQLEQKDQELERYHKTWFGLYRRI